MVRIVYLGKFADWAGRDEEEFEAPLDWNGLTQRVEPRVAEELRGDRAHISLDGVVLADKQALSAKHGSEVALLPPVSGG